MPSVLDLLTDSIDEQTVHQMTAQLGADDQSTGQALNAAMPMLLGALGKNTSTPEGADALMGALARKKQEENMSAQQMASMLQEERESTEEKLTGLAAMLDMDGDGNVSDDLSVLGSSLLGSLFGRKRS